MSARSHSTTVQSERAALLGGPLRETRTPAQFSSSDRINQLQPVFVPQSRHV
jgi:hypothetical protein